MSIDTHTANAAKLRQAAATIAIDIAQAPLQNRHHQTLVALNTHFVALEKTLTATSDTLTNTIARAQDLVMEALRWSSTSYNATSLQAALDQSLASIDGGATVNNDSNDVDGCVGDGVSGIRNPSGGSDGNNNSSEESSAANAKSARTTVNAARSDVGDGAAFAGSGAAAASPAPSTVAVDVSKGIDAKDDTADNDSDAAATVPTALLYGDEKAVVSSETAHP